MEFDWWSTILVKNYPMFMQCYYWVCSDCTLNAVLTDRRSLSGKQPKSANGKSSSCQFSFLDKRNANTEVTEYATFGFSLVYWFPSLSRKLWTSLSASDKDFLSVLAAIIWENSDKQLVLRIMKALPFIHQPDQVVPKATDVQLIGYINTCEKIQYFFTCCYSFSQGQKSAKKFVW